MIIIFNQDITTFLDCAFCIELGNLLNPQEVIENLLTAQLMNQRVQRVMPGFFTPILNPLIRNKGRLGNFKLNIIGVYQCHFIQYNDDPIGSAKGECSSWHHFKNHMIQTIFKFHLRQIFISALLVSACPPVLRVLWQGEAGALCQLQRCPGRSGWRITLRSPASPPGVLRLLQPLWPMACRGVVPCE